MSVPANGLRGSLETNRTGTRPIRNGGRGGVTSLFPRGGDSDFTDDVHLFDYGYVDSFGAVDLVSFVQQTFGIAVSQSDMIAYPMNTINEIAMFASLRQKGEL